MIRKKNFMSLQALLILSAIDKCGGKKKVSEILGLSLDTINKYISILEEDLGYELLVNNGRGSQLTMRCQELIKHANIIEDIFNNIYDDEVSNKELRGNVLVNMPLSVSTNLLPRIISDFFEQYPNINLINRTVMDNTDFSTMDSDIGLTFLPPNNNDVVILHTKQVECGYFASPKYIEKYGYPKDIEDMLENHWIVTRVQLQNFIHEWKDVVRNAKHTRYVTNSTYAATEIVRCGGGIAIMPLRYKNEDGFVCLEEFKCDEAPIVYLIAKKKSKDIPKVRIVIDYYKRLMEDM
ncbi:MAG: LysR family transcriptional regulator [Alphaproteobacteria bacterium]|nr:LysR family transcriptional regulator [Alphaproteobacteria bacterium]